MDTLKCMRAFLAVADAGSFSEAARRMCVATSVASKRVEQLEELTGTRLFTRTTRLVTLNDAGQDWIASVRSIVADMDDVVLSASRNKQQLGGPLRLKLPTALTNIYIGDMLAEFQALHPKIVLEIVLTDRPLNPADEGFDLAVAAFGTSFSGVVDVPLCPLRRFLCASPSYLARHGSPQHPRELSEHATLSFQPTGHRWAFESAQGPIQMEVAPTLSANDGQVLLAAARSGNGIALLSEYLALPFIASGELVVVLEDFPLSDIWVKMLIPDTRMQVTRVRALVSFLADKFQPVPPWHAVT